MGLGIDTALIIGALAVTAGTTAYTQVQAGEAQKDAADAERQQYEENAASARASASQEEAAKLKQLRAVLSSQDAFRAARGLDLGSETGDAIRRESTDNIFADITNIRSNAGSTARRLELAGSAAGSRGDAALIGGYGGAANTIGSAAVSGFRLSGPTPRTTP